jgi:hypothetical protein
MKLFMKFLINKKKFLPALGVACLLPLSLQTAQASSTINSYVNLTYTINSIGNSSGTGDQSGLAIIDSYEISSHDPLFNTPDNLSITNGSTVNKTFSLSSTVEDGFATYSENASIGLNFLNTTSDTSYDVQVTLDYLLSADSAANVGTGSDYANTYVWLSYFSTDNNFSGSDGFIPSWSNPMEQLGILQINGSSGLFSFTLAPGGVEALFADVKISGNLQASVVPVPVPSAIWLFASALLALPGVNRIKSRA